MADADGMGRLENAMRVARSGAGRALPGHRGAGGGSISALDCGRNATATPASPKQQRDPNAGFVVDIPVAALPALRRAARARDTNLNRLVFDLLTVIASDGLVNAILDDK